MKRCPAIVLALLLTTGLGGCASKYGAQNTTVNYYPGCYRPIADLRQNENNTAKGTVTGSVIGALGGALVGLLAGGGRWQGAVVGGAMGAATGAMAGNYYARKQQEADDNIRLASYMQDLDGDISNLTVAQAAARTSLQCYDQQFRLLLADIKAGQIGREQAQARYAEIVSGREEAIGILGQAAQSGRNMDQEYEQAFMNEQQNMQSPARQAEGRGAYAQKSQALNSARTRKNDLAKKTASIEQDRDQAREVTAQQTRAINQAMANLSDIRA